MSSTPKISIVTPVWNGIKYIKDTIDSVLAEEFQDWELVVGDNCSTDGTSEYLRSLKDPRIRVFVHDKNYGVYYNIRFVWSKARAPYAFGLCADDYFFPGAINKILAAWETAPANTAWITYNWKHRQMKHTYLTELSYERMPKVLDPKSAQLAFFLFGNYPGNFSEVCVKTDIVNSSADFIPEMPYSGDFEYWGRLAKTHPVVLCDDHVVFIRRHDEVAGKTLNMKGERFAQSRPVYERLIDELSPVVGREKMIRFYHYDSMSFQFHDALAAILRGSFDNMKAFLAAKGPIVWPLWKRLLLCFPLAITERVRLRAARKVAEDIIDKWEFQKVR